MHVRPLRVAAFAVSLAFAALSGCSSGPRASTVDDYRTRTVTFPNGTRIRAELATHPKDVVRGMKFRPSLAPDAGMLFIHGKEGSYRYWMYEVQIPLDLVWLNSQKQIVQIVHNAPPCPGPADKCPNYGGAFPSSYVLEVAAGTVAKNNLKPGMTLDF